MELTNNKNNIPKPNKTETKIFIPSDDKSIHVQALKSIHPDLEGISITTATWGDDIDIHFKDKPPMGYDEFSLGSLTRITILSIYSDYMTNKEN